MAEPLAYGLLRSAERSAWHLELRDGYVLDDPDWLDWQAGRRFEPLSGGLTGLTSSARRPPVALMSAASGSCRNPSPPTSSSNTT